MHYDFYARALLCNDTAFARYKYKKERVTFFGNLHLIEETKKMFYKKLTTAICLLWVTYSFGQTITFQERKAIFDSTQMLIACL